MNKHCDEALKAVVAETSPVICSGMVSCLRRLSSVNLQVMEAHTYSDLCDCVAATSPDIVIVNPAFCGGFSPKELRKDTGKDFKTAAIGIGKLDKATLDPYDGALSIADDLDTIDRTVNILAGGENLPEDQQEETLRKKDALSTREKEIVSLVVKGLTNKDIADRLYLSIHTVVTHRRNIARKLDIHSSTGLTIYAIVNKLVDLSEIKL